MSPYAAESERLWLEPLSPEKHMDEYHEMMIHPQTLAFSTRCTTIEQSRAYMLERLPHAEKPWIENYAILLRPDPASGHENGNGPAKPRFIGAVGVIRFEEGSGAEVGYGIHPEYQRKGYATEALRLFVELYWSRKREGDWNTLVAAVDPENTASERVVQKVGFTKGQLQDEEFEMWSESGKGRVVRHREWLLMGPS
ncbi:hypothetical protein CJF30_00004666 [Rutstroemia sp. NJR-2017a BBW]|nr:hypothetical protein CJF30_00004666 [Rutstroemia sp. NJR-2017a BBW]